MSQVAKSASAFVRAFLAILVLELEDMVVRLFRPPKLAGVHGDRWTVRLGISVDMRCPPWRLASRRAGGAQLCRAIVANADGDAAAFWFSMPLEISSRSASAKAIEDERQRRITCPPIGQTAKGRHGLRDGLQRTEAREPRGKSAQCAADEYERYGHSEVGRDTESRNHSHNRGE